MAASQDRNWEDYLKGLEVNIRPALFGRQSAPKSTDENIAAVEKEFRGFELPEDYQEFVKQIGPGTLGRVRIYAYEMLAEFEVLLPRHSDLQLISFLALRL